MIASLRHLLHRRRAGKIARLPPSVREQINLMLQDGLTYQAIIDALGQAGAGLNKDNLSRWRKADHQDWLAEQHFLEATRDRPESSPVIKDMCLFLRDIDDDHLQKILSRNPTRFLNVLARLSDPDLSSRLLAPRAQSSRKQRPIEILHHSENSPSRSDAVTLARSDPQGDSIGTNTILRD